MYAHNAPTGGSLEYNRRERRQPGELQNGELRTAVRLLQFESWKLNVMTMN